MAQRSARFELAPDLAPALLKAVAGYLLEITVYSVPVWNRVDGDLVNRLGEFQIAFLGDLHSPQQQVRLFAEGLPHLLRAPEIVFRRAIGQAVGIVDGLSRTDAQQRVVGFDIRVHQVMRIVRRDHRDAGLFGQLHQRLPNSLLRVQAVLLDLQVVISLPQDVLKLQGRPRRVIKLVHQQQVRGNAADASRQPDNPLAVFRQQLSIYPRLAPET